MSIRVLVIMASAAALAPLCAAAQVLLVPSHYPTIQSAVDAAPPGATVLVAPGSYRENLLIAKPLRLVSSGGAAVTRLDGGRMGTVIQMRGSGGEQITLKGFSIVNGSNGGPDPSQPTPGGGLYIDSVVATVTENVIADNAGCLGPGVSTTLASLRLERNLIRDNVQDAVCFGAMGGGVFMNGGGTVPSVIAENVITGHRIGGDGAGIALNAVPGVTLSGNVIRNNQSDGRGGGLYINASSANVRSNLISGNIGVDGGGLSALATEPGNRISIVANAFDDNTAQYGSAAALLSYYEGGLGFVRNIAKGRSPASLVNCDGQPFAIPRSNVLLNAGGPELGGTCMLAGQ